MTSSFNKWIPFSGACTKEKASELTAVGVSDPYVWRASYLPVLNVSSQFVLADEDSFPMLRFGLCEWKRVSPFLLKEFYPLTPWHRETDTSGFTAFCYFDPTCEEGVLLAFRQERCRTDTLQVALPFGKEHTTYVFTDEDTGEETVAERTLTLSFSSPRTAKLLWIRRA